MKTASSMQRGRLCSRLVLCAAAVVVAGLQLGQSVAPAVVSLRQLAAQTREQAQSQNEDDDAPQDVAVAEQMCKFVLRRSVGLPRPMLVSADAHPAHKSRHTHADPRDAGRWQTPSHPNSLLPGGVRLLI